jgi:hypothetical protein
MKNVKRKQIEDKTRQLVIADFFVDDETFGRIARQVITDED